MIIFTEISIFKIFSNFPSTSYTFSISYSNYFYFVVKYHYRTVSCWEIVHITHIMILLSGQRSELGIGQRYIKYLASVSRSGELHSSNHVARIENFRNIKTFDGNAYTIPGTILLSTKVW